MFKEHNFSVLDQSLSHFFNYRYTSFGINLQALKLRYNYYFIIFETIEIYIIYMSVNILLFCTKSKRDQNMVYVAQYKTCIIYSGTNYPNKIINKQDEAKRTKESPLKLAAANTWLWHLLENGFKQIGIQRKLDHSIESHRQTSSNINGEQNVLVLVLEHKEMRSAKRNKH